MKKKLSMVFVLCSLFLLCLSSVAIANSNPTNSPPYPPTDPSPTDGKVITNRDVTISWKCAGDPNGDPVVYDVYFGTTGFPPFSHTQPGTSYSTGILEFKTYYWKIVVRDGKGGETVGSVWSFTVVQGIEISSDATTIEWKVTKPGTYITPEGIKFTVKSNGKVDVEFIASNLVDSSGSEIETWYAVGDNIGAAESFGWKKSFTIPLDPAPSGPSGITIQLWSKIIVTECNSAGEYSDSPTVTAYPRG